jgi:hypothetical protein
MITQIKDKRMKLQYAKMIVLLFTAFSIGNRVNAQDENASERFSTQLKNNRVPGWQYTNTEPVKTSASVNKENNREGLAAQIRKGTAPGMKFLPTTAGYTPARMTQKRSAVKTAPLASEQMPAPKTVPQIKTIPVPTQEEPKEKK